MGVVIERTTLNLALKQDEPRSARPLAPRWSLYSQSPSMSSQLLFLPGALGRTEFWQPVANLLVHPATKIHFGWPGFGTTKPDPKIRGIDDLVTKVVARINQPTALIAQSMGGVVAIRAALEVPDLVTHLVLAVTSGGIDVAGLGGQNWRPSFLAANPLLPRWFSTYQEDLSQKLSKVTMPSLLLWGDVDLISPLSVGKHLAGLLPYAHLHIVHGGGHDLAETHASSIAPLIDDHLNKAAPPNIPLDLAQKAAQGR